MPLPIVTDCFQATFVWSATSAPRPATTTLHFFDTSGAGTEFGLYTAINTNVTAQMWNCTSSNGGVDTVNITKLDGVSAGVGFATGRPAKWTGNGGSDLILQGSAVVSIKSAQRGPQGRNRIFTPWVDETSQTNGTLAGASVTAMQTAWNNFATAVAAGPYEMAVVSGVHSAFYPYTSIVVRPFLKTQRRRARR